METATSGPPLTAARLVVERLKQYGVSVVFGYPGGPLAPLYDALFQEPAIRHILARDEQGAGFMADGYARATGRPGVCLAVCGPGVYNALTPLATAFSDSVPLLLLSGQVPSRDPRSGYYHENDQLRVCEPVTKARFRAETAADVVPSIDRAWRALIEGRPGPVLWEAPGRVLSETVPTLALPPCPSPPQPLVPSDASLDAAAQAIAGWRRPVILAGGGVIAAGAAAELRQVAERLGAPVFHTLMGKTAIPGTHRLAAGLPWKEGTSDASDMRSRMSPLLFEADGMLAVGCRFTQVTTGTWSLPVPQSLVHVDVDASEFHRHYRAQVAVVGNARLALSGLLRRLPGTNREPWTDPRPPRPVWTVAGKDLAGALRRAIPEDAIVAADVTRLAYVMLVEFPADQPRSFLHPAAAVSMGFALPAALGAKAAFPRRPVVAVMGDGGFQITGMELATAVQEDLPIVLVVVNDGCLTLIKALQQRKFGGRFIGVDLRNPDFGRLASAFGVAYARAEDEAGLERCVREALDAGRPALVEMKLA
jgi:acetolactate synthase-1/2/3 large subunit